MSQAVPRLLFDIRPYLKTSVSPAGIIARCGFTVVLTGSGCFSLTSSGVSQWMHILRSEKKTLRYPLCLTALELLITVS